MGKEMAKEICPSSYVCDCGYQCDFFENTVREMKQLSARRPQRLGADDGRHVVVFDQGRMVDLICPHQEPKEKTRKKTPRK
jgi:hypothetical protein